MVHAPRQPDLAWDVPLVAWWFTQAKVLLLYLKLAVWPWPLTIHYDLPLVQSFDAAWMFVLPVAVLVAGTLVAVWRNWAVGFVGVWVFAILAPTLVVPIVKEVAAERRMYLPLVALVALAVVVAIELARKYLAVDEETGARRLPPVAAVTVGALLVAMVFGQASIARFVGLRRCGQLVAVGCGLESGRLHRAAESWVGAVARGPQRGRYSALRAGDVAAAGKHGSME